MRVLLLAGAGTSVELGVPGMLGMGEEFLRHSQQWEVEPELVERLIGESLDVEHLIEALDQICSARNSLEIIGQDMEESIRKIDKVRSEVEWFVQHVAERVLARDAQLIWGSVLRAATTADFDLTLTTTNYDRAIELAANAEGVSLDDGFAEFDESEIAEWIGFQGKGSRTQLVKLHGSTDWYADADQANPTKLRHPMPLFGRASLTLAGGRKLGSALVLPSREKLLTRQPYPRLSQTFLNAADSCDLAVFIGSSLRDHHIRAAAATTAARVPVFIINPDGENYGLTGIPTIRECASTFLMATLPNAIVSVDPIAALSEAAGRRSNGGNGILGLVRIALDSDLLTVERCKALEELDASEIILDQALLRLLLTDGDPQVARYALGLIAVSPAREALLKEAAAVPHLTVPTFSHDLDLLRQLSAA